MAYEMLTLGSLLRLTLDRLDRDVETTYRERGLRFKPRYTSIYRLLATSGEMRIGDIVLAMDLSQPSITNTLNAMRADELVEIRRGSTDARERIVTLSPAARAMADQLEMQWKKTAAAAASLDADLGLSLEELLRDTLRHLDRRSLRARMIDEAPSSVSD